MPSGLSQRPTHWFLKFQALNPAGFKNSWNPDPHFPRQTLQRFVFPLHGLSGMKVYFLPFSVPLAPSPIVDNHGLFSSQTLCVCDLLPSSMWPLPCLLLWSLFCQSSSYFLDYLCWYSYYLVISMGWGKVRGLLLHLLPSWPLPMLCLIKVVKWVFLPYSCCLRKNSQFLWACHIKSLLD